MIRFDIFFGYMSHERNMINQEMFPLFKRFHFLILVISYYFIFFVSPMGLPTGSEGLPTSFKVLPAGSEALSAGSETQITTRSD